MYNTSGCGRAELSKLLNDYNEYPERRDQIVAEIDRDFGRTVAILIMDSCGFSRTVHANGIIHFLSLLERLWRLVRPLVAEHGGRPLREDADDLFAVFPDVPSALACARAIHEHVEIANGPLPASNEIYVALGIGFGRVLLVGSDDAWGDEMNLACKLGEDIAQEGEILLTEEARKALGDDSGHQFEKRELSISGLQMTAYQVIR
jgi:class 3 adenylate cyclase